MTHSLNFNKLKKQYLIIELSDEENTKVSIGTPTKKILDGFLNMKDELDNDNISENALDEVYELITLMLNRNRENIKISKEKIEELLDFEDIIIFTQTYSDFVSELTNQKN